MLHDAPNWSVGCRCKIPAVTFMLQMTSSVAYPVRSSDETGKFPNYGWRFTIRWGHRTKRGIFQPWSWYRRVTHQISLMRRMISWTLRWSNVATICRCRWVFPSKPPFIEDFPWPRLTAGGYAFFLSDSNFRLWHSPICVAWEPSGHALHQEWCLQICEWYWMVISWQPPWTSLSNVPTVGSF